MSDVQIIQGLRRQLAEARADAAHYWPAHAAELARVRLGLQPAHARLLTALLAARGAVVPWERLAPSVRRACKPAVDGADERLVHVHVCRLRALLDLAGYARAIDTHRGPRGAHGYAVAADLGGDIVQRLGVALPPEANPPEPASKGTVS